MEPSMVERLLSVTWGAWMICPDGVRNNEVTHIGHAVHESSTVIMFSSGPFPLQQKAFPCRDAHQSISERMTKLGALGSPRRWPVEEAEVLQVIRSGKTTSNGRHWEHSRHLAMENYQDGAEGRLWKCWVRNYIVKVGDWSQKIN